MSLDKCPKCGSKEIILTVYDAVLLEKKKSHHPKRMRVICNGRTLIGQCCDQKLWYYHRTGRITRRSK